MVDRKQQMLYYKNKIINVLVDGPSKSGKTSLISQLSGHFLHIGTAGYEKYLKPCVEQIVNGEQVTLIFYENKNDKYLQKDGEFNIQFHAYLLVFDIADELSLNDCLIQSNKFQQSNSAIKFLLSNKCEESVFQSIIQNAINKFQKFQTHTEEDIKEFLYESNKMFQTDIIEQFINQNNFYFYPISCRIKRNIQLLKDQIMKLCLNNNNHSTEYISITNKIAQQKKLNIVKNPLINEKIV